MSKLIRDTRLLLTMHIQDTLRNPVFLIMGLVQPVIWLLLFAPLLEGLMHVPGFEGSHAIGFFAPGLLVMLAVVSTLFAGMGVINDVREGIIEKLRVTPVARFALPLSLIARDGIMLMMQMGMLLLIGALLGLRPDPVGLALMFPLIMLVGLFVASISYILALSLKNEYALSGAANFFLLPLVLLSGISLPLTLGPPFLQLLGSINPFSHAVNAARALSQGHLAHTAVSSGFVLFAMLFALAFIWSARSFRRISR